jgi:pimeloyl-ACP methyl ester carboxylesterase
VAPPAPPGGGRLVKVAWAANQAEAELIEGILREEGIPSVERRTRGFDVPDFLAAGPRDILVPEEAAEAARELLHGSPVRGTTHIPEPADGGVAPAAFARGFVIAVALAVLVVLALYLLAT